MKKFAKKIIAMFTKELMDKIKSEKGNQKLSSSFLKSLINLQKFNEAITYSQNLESKNLLNMGGGLNTIFTFTNYIIND